MSSNREEENMKRPYQTETHIMRGGRLVPKPRPVTLPLNDPIRKIRRGA